MYKIIGGDGREYGPITDADMRQWIAEGRLNAQSLAGAESDAEFRPLSTFPEFADAFGTATFASDAPASFAPAVDWSHHDYELDIGGCISRGWNLFMSNAGTLLGATIIYLLIIIMISAVIITALNGVLLVMIPKETLQSPPFKIGTDIIFRIISALVFGPLSGGFYYIFIQRLRGQPAGAGDIFIGFQKAFAQLFLSYVVFTLTMALCFVPYSFVVASRLVPLLAQMQHGATPQQMQEIMPQLFTVLAGTLPIMLVCMVPAFYLITNLQFALPLIVDGGMDFWTALKTSWKMVHKHWWTVFGLFIVLGLINLVGFLVCCVGVLFTIPLTTAALMVAYETIFGRSRAASDL